ncbi:hypothetical protein BB561_003360 [Smittium simulii]|uniref:Uncharacterized protein n=1 Tax=Smittium simulii TaxID=133385 RepID=A0A2T9YLS4_9FUNG|nr:hypothetical protein BB561_003360 [Smittium simulii]
MECIDYKPFWNSALGKITDKVGAFVEIADKIGALSKITDKIGALSKITDKIGALGKITDKIGAKSAGCFDLTCHNIVNAYRRSNTLIHSNMISYQLNLDSSSNCLVNCALNLGSSVLTNYTVSQDEDSVVKFLECVNISDYKQVILCSSKPDFNPCNDTNSNSSAVFTTNDNILRNFKPLGDLDKMV